MDKQWISHTILANPKTKAAEVIAAAHREELARMLARAAQIGGAIQELLALNVLPPYVEEGLLEALAGAPRVLYNEPAKTRVHDGQRVVLLPQVCMTTEQDVLRVIHAYAGPEYETWGPTSDEVRLIITSRQGCPPSGEQGYKRARGAIPWQEGDELPEDVIARLRGRPREGEQE